MVDQLKDKIKAKMSYSFPAPDLTLYVAKMDEDAAWLQDGCESDAIKPYLIEANKMKPLHRLCRQRFNFTEGMDEGDIHVVQPHRRNELRSAMEMGTKAQVMATCPPTPRCNTATPPSYPLQTQETTGLSNPTQPPSKKANIEQSKVSKQLTAKATWKREKPPVNSVAQNSFYFVDREHAILTRQDLHKNNYFSALEESGGEGGVIPFADGVEGLGKSTLGRHYVRRSRKEWKYRFAKQPTVFEEALGTCHTVHLDSARGQLLTPSFDAVLIHMLVEKLRGMFANPPAILGSPPASVFAFLDRLTDEVGPLFLVLDEIGAAFTDASLSDLDSHERFIAFCDDVVCQWCDMPNVFFVLVGRGSFLGLVETNMTTMRKYFLCRFGLNRLRPPDIKTIMQRTFIEVGGATIQEACAVDDTQLEGVAQRLFEQTCGHPGALVEAFKTCASYSALMAYQVPADAVDQALVFDMLTKHKAVVGEMLMKMLRQERTNLRIHNSSCR
ncbi:hypothetical protein DYB36_008568 [Aphanomyces astaci]|uniref:Crinkler effector protein N-terminal domain-containing protein n=1 Tax=Aphanomyces astaci TaxID=112090 RepID=A0A397BBL8_APHAT|nr:hypothetical protein DYB36_008568 [Aphanomyces astaci]